MHLTGYFCSYCEYSFEYKSKYERHLTTLKHKTTVTLIHESCSLEVNIDFPLQQKDVDMEFELGLDPTEELALALANHSPESCSFEVCTQYCILVLTAWPV